MELFLTELVFLMSCWCFTVGVAPLYQQGASRVISVCEGKLHGVLCNVACSQSILWADNFHFHMVPTFCLSVESELHRCSQEILKVDNRKRCLLFVDSFWNGETNSTINTATTKNKEAFTFLWISSPVFMLSPSQFYDTFYYRKFLCSAKRALWVLHLVSHPQLIRGRFW